MDPDTRLRISERALILAFFKDFFKPIDKDLIFNLQIFDLKEKTMPHDFLLRFLLLVGKQSHTNYLLLESSMWENKNNQDSQHYLACIPQKIWNKEKTYPIAFICHPKPYNVKMALKLIPITTTEFKHFPSVAYPAWREANILSKCSDLINEGITPNLPFNYGYLPMSKLPSKFINNTNILRRGVKKYKHGAILLNELQSYDLEDMVDKLFDEKDRELNLSELTGKRYTKEVKNQYDDILAVIKSVFIRSLIATNVLHKKLKIIHGDLHRRNILIRTLPKYSANECFWYSGEKGDLFIPCYKFSPIIWDFGRSLDFKTQTHAALREGLITILKRTSARYFPSTKHKVDQRIGQLFSSQNNIEILFQYATLLDLLKFIENIYYVLEMKFQKIKPAGLAKFENYLTSIHTDCIKILSTEILADPIKPPSISFEALIYDTFGGEFKANTEDEKKEKMKVILNNSPYLI